MSVEIFLSSIYHSNCNLRTVLAKIVSHTHTQAHVHSSDRHYSHKPGGAPSPQVRSSSFEFRWESNILMTTNKTETHV